MLPSGWGVGKDGDIGGGSCDAKGENVSRCENCIK